MIFHFNRIVLIKYGIVFAILSLFLYCADKTPTDIETKNYRLSGKVYSLVDSCKMFVENVKVILKDDTTKSDEDGYFAFENVPTGEYHVSFLYEISPDSVIQITELVNIIYEDFYNEYQLFDRDAFDYFPISLNDSLFFNYTRIDISSTPITIRYIGISKWKVTQFVSKNDFNIFSVTEKVEGMKITETVIDDPQNWHIDSTFSSFAIQNKFEIIQFEDSTRIEPPGYFSGRIFKTKFIDYSAEHLVIIDNLSQKFHLKLNMGIYFYFNHGVGGNNYSNYILERIY